MEMEIYFVAYARFDFFTYTHYYWLELFSHCMETDLVDLVDVGYLPT